MPRILTYLTMLYIILSSMNRRRITPLALRVVDSTAEAREPR
jgi:hypothetical protein